MKSTFQETIIEPIKECYIRVLEFMPSLLASILIFVLGVFLSFILKKVFIRVFKTVNLDKLSEKFGITEVLRKWGVKESVSLLLTKVLGWIIIFSFLLISLLTLRIATIEGFLRELFLYTPNVFTAILILLAGYLLSNFLGRTALIASVNAGLKISGFIGKFVKFTVFFLAVTMALEQLGIGKDTILVAFAVIFGGVVLTLAIAFGVGGQDAAKEYIDKRLKGEGDEDEIQHL
ncbi:MAG TPA: hypothetical protein ENH40_03530 [Nitrospirae bacterium]|nr:hypothetical protein [Nitrospirota bacterium]